jgi:hypothetical protein
MKDLGPTRVGLLAIAVAVLAVWSSTAVAGTRQASTAHASAVCDTGKVHFAKTKFVFHMGLAFGAFDRYIYKPFKAGSFDSGQSGRIKAGVKAALAAAFVWHELKIACKDANNSSVLKPLLAPLSLVATELTALGQKLKAGSFNTSDLATAGDAINGLQQKSTSLGFPIKQRFGGFSG